MISAKCTFQAKSCVDPPTDKLRDGRVVLFVFKLHANTLDSSLVTSATGLKPYLASLCTRNKQQSGKASFLILVRWTTRLTLAVEWIKACHATKKSEKQSVSFA